MRTLTRTSINYPGTGLLVWFLGVAPQILHAQGAFFFGSNFIATGGGGTPVVTALSACQDVTSVGNDYSLPASTTTSGAAIWLFFASGNDLSGAITISSTIGGSASGDTFTQIGSNNHQAFQSSAQFSALNIHAGTSNYVIKATIAGATGVVKMCALQITNVTAVDTPNCTTAASVGASPVTCTSGMTPTASPAVVVAGLGNYYGATTFTITGGNALTLGNSSTGSNGSPGSGADGYYVCASSCTGTSINPSFDATGPVYATPLGAVFK